MPFYSFFLRYIVDSIILLKKIPEKKSTFRPHPVYKTKGDCVCSMHHKETITT